MPIDALLRETVSVPRAIVRVLEDAGIDMVFGMPGGRTGAIFDALYDHRDKPPVAQRSPSWRAACVPAESSRDPAPCIWSRTS